MDEFEICKHLDIKLEEFLQKIKPSELKESIKENIYFAGGCIYSLRNNRDVKDYDMFLKTNELNGAMKDLDIWSFESEYALTCGKFQVVIKYFGDPYECVGQFDFKHNMHYYVPGTKKIMCAYAEELSECEDPTIDNFIYLQTDELFFNENRARDIEGVWLRIEKFTNRGMKISKETKKKIKKRVTKKSVKAYRKSRHSRSRSYY